MEDETTDVVATTVGRKPRQFHYSDLQDEYQIALQNVDDDDPKLVDEVIEAGKRAMADAMEDDDFLLLSAIEAEGCSSTSSSSHPTSIEKKHEEKRQGR